MDQIARVANVSALHNPLANKGTAFSGYERDHLRLAGWLPPRIETLEEQAARTLAALRAKPTPIERHAFLAALQNDNETLFFKLVVDNVAELLPLVYTPTVGQACLEWSQRYFTPRGLYLTPQYAGRIADILRSWPRRDVGIIVVTDGGRILGLGDLGANGMGIPIGKLALYTACAGVPPWRCLPITLDVGTDNAALRDDPFYLGRRVPRLVGDAYDAFLEEFVAATQEVFPGVVLQFEDFNNANAFRLLARYRDRVCCFNDDIQGTGAMTLAGFLAAARLTGRSLAEERILFFGAGEACLGAGGLLLRALERQGASREEALAHCLFLDTKGAVVAGRTDLPPQKRAVAHDGEHLGDLLAAVESFRPTALVGACGCGRHFTQPVLEAMARICPQPVIFALSNPTSKSECTAVDAYRWTQGRAVFASGSPFEPVELGGRTHAPGQANNAYIFPGVGQGLLVAGATRVSDTMFFAAAEALADCVTPGDLAAGRVFPQQMRLREVALAVATAVARVAHEEGLATHRMPPVLPVAVQEAMYRPAYSG